MSNIGLNSYINDKLSNLVQFRPKQPSVEQETPTNSNEITSSFTTLTRNHVLGYFSKCAKTIGSAVADKVSEKAKEMKIMKLFADYGVSLENMKDHKDFIKKIALLDYKNIEEKFDYCKKELLPLLPEYNQKNLYYVQEILECEELTVGNLRTMHEMAKSVYNEHSKWNATLSPADIHRNVVYSIDSIMKYENFDLMSTSDQKAFIRHFNFYLSESFINNINEFNDIMKFSLISDIKRCGSIANLRTELQERMKNKPVNTVNIDSSLIKAFIDDYCVDMGKIQKTISELDLDKYKNGLPLQYSRNDFISDFNKEIKNMSLKERKEIFDYYQFSIDSENDIIKFPIPSSNADTTHLSPKVQSTISKTNQYVNNFVLNNKIVLDEEDKAAEEVLNKFIEVFPEFISIIGKTQHRGDSIDHHTLENLQLCFKNPETKKLSEEEKRILFFSVMFHDIAKKANIVDFGHQKPSSFYAKELMKKLPVSYAEKTRVYNIIANSHWLTDVKPAKDLAAIFRNTNDFKIAQIMSKADSESSGFEYAPDPQYIDEVNSYIVKIQATGIPLFADNLPEDTSKFPTDKQGVKYLDFTDKDADLTQFGFPAGTKVKDLNFLCHSSIEDFNSLLDICDDSKEICLSTSFLNASGSVSTGYNNGANVIIYSSHPDIAVAGAKVACTGGQRGFEHFKDYIYGENHCWESEENKAEHNKANRTELPNFIKAELGLSDNEYLELYKHLENYSDKNDIQSITLSTGKELESETIQNTLDNMHEYLLTYNKNNAGYYLNETVVFQPKIQAVVMNKNSFMNTDITKSKIKQAAKDNNITVILV